MKKVFFLTIVLTLGVFWSCEKETEDIQSTVELNQNNNLQETDGKGFYLHCFYYLERGLRIGNNCLNQFNGICSIRKICIPIIIYDPCWIVPCWIDIIDPWDIYREIDPREFLSLRDKLELDIDPRVTAVPFALNEQVAGLQMYQEEGFFEDNVLRLEEDLILDAETSKALGLQGNVVKAGKYPVIANKENGTFNAILSVEKGFER